ncbi:alpha-(1,3)-fucosyltransferase C [Trichonephila clavata]|uniref:Fucosyltransferase n=1 Tax=Trichonephila clavata TaxID=2740835 RepID=A0A8X6EYI9_TRICU|nr:alpha-(1,3)-fucosyltransferase C [Trichonephila clavata]
MKRWLLRCFHINISWKTLVSYCLLAISVTALSAHFFNDFVHVPIKISKENQKPTGKKFFKRIFHRKSVFPEVREYTINPRLSKFTNENARVIGFPIRDYKSLALVNSDQKTIYLATAYFGEWNPEHFYSLHLGNETFLRYSCPVFNCRATKDPAEMRKADALLFHVRDLEVYSIPRRYSPKQVWILYSMEPPWLEIRDMKRFDGVFNWTMSYRRKSDVLMSYGFIGEKLKPAMKLSKLRKRMALMKSKLNRAVWFVSNCHTDSNREEYVNRLKRVYPVDVFGGCGMEACRPAETQKCYSQVSIRYKFYISFENAICRDYVTEKLFNPLNFDIVPVVLGGVNYSSLAPPHSVINAMEFDTPEELGHFLWKVSSDNSLYLSYFEWKNTYRSYLQPWMCDLCEKLHKNTPSKTKNNLVDWWNEGYSCLKWSNNSFKRVSQHPFPVYNSKLRGLFKDRKSRRN